MLGKRQITHGIPAIAAIALLLGLTVLGLPSTLAQQNTPTPTVPVQTQVWLDLTATAGAPPPAANAFTATYEAEFANAVLTVTAASQSTPVTAPPETTDNRTPMPAGSESALRASASELVPVTGGVFLMGTTLEEASQAVDECALYGSTCDIAWTADSMPAHPVTVDSFQIEVLEVSAQQFVQFLNEMGPNSHLTGCEGQRCAATAAEVESSFITFDGQEYGLTNEDILADKPITSVTWYGAQAYCQTIGRRLPTEAEWERAARGPENYIYPWGFTFDPARANSSQSGTDGTTNVYEYQVSAGPYGAVNQAGNVQEWVADWYRSDYYAQQADNPTANPQGPPTGTEKVLRGGSWDTGPLFLRTVHRRSAQPLETSPAVGFRCAVDAQPQAASTPTSAPANG